MVLESFWNCTKLLKAKTTTQPTNHTHTPNITKHKNHYNLSFFCTFFSFENFLTKIWQEKRITYWYLSWNRHTKINILPIWIQQCIKRIAHHDQLEFFPEMQGWFTEKVSSMLLTLLAKIKIIWSFQKIQRKH